MIRSGLNMRGNHLMEISTKDLINEILIIAAYDTESLSREKSLCLLSRSWNGWIFDVDYLSFEYFKKLNSEGLPITLDTNMALYTWHLFSGSKFFTVFDALDMVMHISEKEGWLDNKAIRGFFYAVNSVLPHQELWSKENSNRKYTEKALKDFIKKKFTKEISKAKPYRESIY